MSTFIGAIINGIVLGMAYALIAVGYSLVFGILRLINFAHGSIYAFGGSAMARVSPSEMVRTVISSTDTSPFQ